MKRYTIPVWEMCVKALEQLDGGKKYVSLKNIVDKVRELWLTENVNEETIRCQIFRHCVNCHPTHDQFPDGGKMWRRRKLFVTDGKGNYRFYDEKSDREIYLKALQEDEEGIEVPSVFPKGRKKKRIRTIPLTDIYKEAIQKLQIIGNKLGFKPENGIRIEGGEVDHVWFIDFGTNLPYFGSKIPIVGFEIETSWRTRKHIKGDIFNLLTLNSAFGIILFLRQGFRSESQFRGNIDAAERYVRTLEGGKRIFVWSEEEINELLDRVNLLHK
jgi:hypothetical protein